MLLLAASSLLMLGPGVFDVDKNHARYMEQAEYRWAVSVKNLRPLAALFVATEGNCFLCGGVGYDIFMGKRMVLTPSFSPGIYFHAAGKNLGFPLNFRSAMDLAYEFSDGARIGAQFNHISNAHILFKNPGADSLYIFYAIPFPRRKNASGK
jgi:hypothetical protein